MHTHSAFTLIELMLVLAITVVFFAMGYPSYVHYEADAERNRAQVALTQLSALMEAYFSDHATYKHATITALHANILTNNLDYQLKIISASDSHYSIEIIPTGVQADRDSHCGALILNDLNQRSISGDGDASSCWSM